MKLEAETLVAGRYRLLGKLGSGGMADVWCAEDTMLDRRVALKFLHDRFVQDEQFVERFRREASAAAGLQHPNVVGVFDRGVFEGAPYIAMEYVEGASLKDLIDRGLSVGEAVEIVRQVLAGARYAHAHGIIHRDLKPQNVLVDAEGRARVTDFGIARAGVSEITQTGSVLGTAQYLSPEQAQGLPVTASSDMYSLGVLLYEAITGQVPFDADSPVTIALKQVSERPRPPSALNPAVPRALDAVVLKALAKDPGNRFASADEFLDALSVAEADPARGGIGDTASYEAVAAAAGAPPAEAAPPSPEDRGFFTRNRLIALGVLLALLLGVLAFALTRPAQVLVPTVIGTSQSQAESILRDAGFEVAVKSVPSDNPPGTVLEESPPAGSRADDGSTVTITVSSGLGSAVLPWVAGQPAKRALKILQDRGFRVKQRNEFSNSVKRGLAIGTLPPEGQQVDRGTTVTLLVSGGPKLVTVPSVVGQQQDIAQSQLRAVGLLPDVTQRNSDAPEGEVISQEPGPGSTVRKHSTVTIAVSTGAGTAFVPNVIGDTQSGAKRTLKSQGLSVRIADRTTQDPNEDGLVVDQSPPAGTRLRRGEFVTIFVGRFTPPPPTSTTTTTTTGP